MKFGTKGIGWLIAGVLICLSMTEASGIPGIAGTLAIGMVFIAVYFIRQRFKPRGIGWFIAGGIFCAFCIEEMLMILSGGSYDIMDDLSTVFIGLIAAAILMFVFYRRNKAHIDDFAGSMPEDEDGFEFPYQEEVFREETVETAAEDNSPADNEGVVEVEVSDSEE